ncbi:MAG: HNH endonuclease [Arcobacteraceae bacterium]|nr:HNH endonuclease [Arcobacteraceae bacterium]
MNFLGNDFIISSSIWLIVVFTFIFTFRKKIFSFYYKESDFDKFVTLLKEYLDETYPKINFNFHFVETLEDEPNPDAKKYALIDNIINQYITLELNSTHNKSIPTNKLWGSYTFNSKPNKTKLPEDWLQRKALIFERDEKTCQRCSKKTTIQESDIFMLTPLEKGGQYYFENLLLVCIDCMKIENHKRDTSLNLKYLDIKDELYSLVK